MARRRRRSARALGYFWIAVVVVVGGGAAVLQWLGPPPVRHEVTRTAVAPATRTATALTFAPPPFPVAAAPAPTIPRQEARPIAAPDPALLEPVAGKPGEMLPKIGPGGRTSIVAYARPFDITDPRPRIALVVAGIGLSEQESKNAIEELPGAVTLAFSPYAPDPAKLLDLARKKGHEFLISLPLEPAGYPVNSAGDESLLIGAPRGQNRARLEWALSRIKGYVGATGAMAGMYGERFSAEPDLLDMLERRLAGRGLLYIDARAGKPDPLAVIGRTADVDVDQPAIASVIKANLAKLKDIALRRGAALGVIGWPGPRILQALVSWAATLRANGLVLAPVTALVRRPSPHPLPEGEGRGRGAAAR